MLVFSQEPVQLWVRERVKKTMPDIEKAQIEKQKRGEAALAAFVEANPAYSVDDEQPECRGGTHFITFGSFRAEPVVFKYYDGDRRKEHEKRALELFAPTGFVPRLYPGDTDDILVIERLRGLTMFEAEKNLTQAQLEELYRQLGRAVARIVEMAPGSDMAVPSETTFRATDQSDFYDTPYGDLHVLYRQADLMTFFDTTIGRAARVLRERDVSHEEILSRSLAALLQHRDAILSYPEFVQMDDFHTNNIMADGAEFVGFIDLEMTRPGNEALVLGSALSATCRRQPSCWSSFRRGYEDARGTLIDGELLSLAQTAAPFSTWIRFTWYWSTDDLPWWAVEMDLRAPAVRGVRTIVEAVETIEF